MTQQDNLRERIARAMYADIEAQDMADTGALRRLIDGYLDVEQLADAVIRELGLREESRTLHDGAGGITTNWRTGETTVHSRPATRQCRYVTDWTTDEGNQRRETLSAMTAEAARDDDVIVGLTKALKRAIDPLATPEED